ncbi:MAG: SDR family oxidoreductase [Betaproteobacteria bacterium]|nr:SDR family oxidoreductase [Betaproteobacteria bacterium]
MSDSKAFLANLFDLSGKHILLTGASSGLGRHFARTLTRAGARVAMAARTADKMHALADEIRAEGGTCDVYALDVRDRAAIRACIAAAEAVAPIDVLVNNAGVARPRAPEKLGDDEWDEVYETNLRGPWVLAQEVIKRRLADQRPCSIINIASILGIRAIGHLAPYSAAKAGLINLGRDLCVDLAAKGIRVNALAPGYFITEMNDEWLASPAGDRLRQRVPAKRFGQPAELDGALVFLASDASRFMNGNLITVDGGHTAGV